MGLKQGVLEKNGGGTVIPLPTFSQWVTISQSDNEDFTMYNVNKSIDYLSFTMGIGDPISQILPDVSEIESEKMGGNAYGYNMTRRYQSGLTTMWHTTQKQMGLHCIYSAKALARLEDTPMMLLESILANGYNVSRLDLAVTSSRIDGGKHELTPHILAIAAKDGKVTTKLKNGVQIGQDMTIQTCYFGSLKTRKRLFRAYDKGLEQGIVDNFLVRYELETRQNATQLGKALVKGNDIGALINNYVSVDNPVWQQILGTQSSKPDYAEQEKSLNEDLWSWLMTSCAPALGRAMAQSKTPEIAANNMQLFHDAMMVSYRKHAKGK